MKIPRRHPIFSNINTKKTFPPKMTQIPKPPRFKIERKKTPKRAPKCFVIQKEIKKKREAELPCPTSAMLAMYSCCFAKTGIKVETENRCIKRQD
jgi:hypothetical protein